jgi:hypothetical protein
MKRSCTALNIRELDGQVPNTVLTGDTTDISHITEFDWYEFVWFIDKESKTLEVKRLGRYCGPSFDVADAICQRVISDNGTFYHKTSVIPLSVEERNDPAIQERMRKFQESLAAKLGDEKFKPIPDEFDDDEGIEPYEPIDPDDPRPLPELAEADDITDEMLDKFTNARVNIA